MQIIVFWRSGVRILGASEIRLFGRPGLVVHDKLQQRASGVLPIMAEKVDAPPERGNFIRLQVYQRVVTKH